MTHNQPLISIIVSVDSTENVNNKELLSFIHLNRSLIEVLCIDTNDSDSMRQTMDEFAKQSSSIQLFQQKKGELADARNKALAKASGSYIMFCNLSHLHPSDIKEYMTDAVKKQHADIVVKNSVIFASIRQNSSQKDTDTFMLNDTTKAVMNHYLWHTMFKKTLIDQYQITFPEIELYSEVTFVWQYLSICQTVHLLNHEQHNRGSISAILTPNKLPNRLTEKPQIVQALGTLLSFLTKHHLLHSQSTYYELIFIDYFMHDYHHASPLTKIHLLKTVTDDILPTLPEEIIVHHPFLSIARNEQYDQLVDLSWQDRKVSADVEETFLPVFFDHFLTLLKQRHQKHEAQLGQLIQSVSQLSEFVETTQKSSQKKSSTALKYHNTGEAQLIKLCFKEAASNDPRLIDLLKNLDAESSETLIKIIQRLIRIKHASADEITAGLSFYSLKEQHQLHTLFQTFNQSVYQLDNTRYLYHHYLLPVNSFSPHLFYNNHSLNLLSHAERIKNKTIIDIHGGMGESALLFQQLHAKQIISFERDKNNIEFMQQTIALNHLTNNIICHDDLSSSASEVCTVDKYVSKNGVKNIAFIKINSETDTTYLLEGAVQTIKKYRPTLMINLSQDWDTLMWVKPFIESLNAGYQFTIHKPVTACIVLDAVLIAEQP